MKFMKMRPMRAEFHWGRTDGQTHMAKLIFAFRNFPNAPKKLDNKFNFRAGLEETSRYNTANKYVRYKVSAH